jgi:hypothetical protein
MAPKTAEDLLKSIATKNSHLVHLQQIDDGRADYLVLVESEGETKTVSDMYWDDEHNVLILNVD